MNGILSNDIAFGEFEIVIKVQEHNAKKLFGGMVLLEYERIPKLIFDEGNLTITRSDKLAFNRIKDKVKIELDKNHLEYASAKIAYYCYNGYAETNHFHIEVPAEGQNELNEMDLTFVFDREGPAASADVLRRLIEED